uniref:Uncharacterized protein n=1 Tax=Triticum urartu TaxID=4572 RepID=A0A8R7Q8K2_TRIUA
MTLEIAVGRDVPPLISKTTPKDIVIYKGQTVRITTNYWEVKWVTCTDPPTIARKPWAGWSLVMPPTVVHLPSCHKPLLPISAPSRTLARRTRLQFKPHLPKIIICCKILQFLACALNPCKINPRNKLQDFSLQITWQCHQARRQAQPVELAQRYHQWKTQLILQHPPKLKNLLLLCCTHFIAIQI